MFAKGAMCIAAEAFSTIQEAVIGMPSGLLGDPKPALVRFCQQLALVVLVRTLMKLCLSAP